MVAFDVKKIEVVGLISANGVIEEPDTEPLFHINIYFDGPAGGSWPAATDDGISFRYLTNSSAVMYFSPESSCIAQEAIKRYVKVIS